MKKKGKIQKEKKNPEINSSPNCIVFFKMI